MVLYIDFQTFRTPLPGSVAMSENFPGQFNPIRTVRVGASQLMKNKDDIVIAAPAGPLNRGSIIGDLIEVSDEVFISIYEWYHRKFGDIITIRKFDVMEYDLPAYFISSKKALQDGLSYYFLSDTVLATGKLSIDTLKSSKEIKPVKELTNDEAY